MSRLGKSTEIDSRLVIDWATKSREWDVTANGYKVSFQRNEKILELDSGNGCIIL